MARPRKLSKAFYLGSIVAAPTLGAAAAWGLNALSTSRANAAAPTSWLWLANAGALYGYAITLLFWFRAWQALAGGTVKFKPAKMALFLLLPVFNLYWFFRAVWGWARAYNAHIAQGCPVLEGVNETLFATYCVFTLALVFVNPMHLMKVNVAGGGYASVFLSRLATSAQLCFDAVIVWLVCDAANRLLATPQIGPSGQSPPDNDRGCAGL